MIPIRIRSERVAFDWICRAKGISPGRLVHTRGGGKPDFIYNGSYGYEVKEISNNNRITFTKRQYNSLRNRWREGEVLVFREGEDTPYVIIPFNELPEGGGEIYGVYIYLAKSPSVYYSTIAVSTDEKNELERMRGEIETKIFPQRDWGSVIFQAMCAILCDLELIKFSYADRISPKHFLVDCPYCAESNDIEGRYTLYWLLVCSNCKRKFVAKRRVTKKTVVDYLSLP